MTRLITPRWIVPLLLLLGSCETYHFDQPQPTDKQNIYEFPKNLRGKWTEPAESYSVEITMPDSGNLLDGSTGLTMQMADSSKQLTLTTAAPAAQEVTWLEIDKKQLLLISHEMVKIAAGYWPRKGDADTLEMPSWTSRVQYRVQYDSLQMPKDSTLFYLIKGPLLYEINDQVLKKGYQYSQVGDTIIQYRNDTIRLHLGPYAFLRQLKKDVYVFNIANELIGLPENWWHIHILSLVSKNRLMIGECSSTLLKEPSLITEIPHAKNYFFSSRWTASYMMQLIDQEYFSFDEFEKQE